MDGKGRGQEGKTSRFRATCNERWRLALHESAHITVAMQLNQWRTSCRAEIHEGGGVATLPLGLSKTANAAATAAGAYGEKLTRYFKAPKRRRPKVQSSTLHPEVEKLRADAVEEIQRAYVCGLSSDADAIAQHCISYGGGPADWAKRYRRCRAQARLAVWKHRVAIVETARQLFHDGAVSFEGSDDAFFKPGASAAGSHKPETREIQNERFNI